MGTSRKPREIRLSTTPTAEAVAALRLGDIVYLDGLIYTAREGVYMRALEDKANIPMELPAQSAANFHCSSATTEASTLARSPRQRHSGSPNGFLNGWPGQAPD